jgi:hypothetical protein
MKRRDIFKSIVGAWALLNIGIVDTYGKSIKGKPKYFIWTLTYHLKSPMTYEEYRIKELSWQKEELSSKINHKYKSDNKILSVSVELKGNTCNCCYVFDSEDSFKMWLAEVRSQGVVNFKKRDETIAKITSMGKSVYA